LLWPTGKAFNGQPRGVQIAISDAAERAVHLVNPEHAPRSQWRGRRNEYDIRH
jgi:hypothetical protein